jgi:hypothetical protein
MSNNTEIAPQADRYQLVRVASDVWMVLDLATDEFLTGPDGSKIMDQRDAHDLRQEYIWS